MKYLQDYREDKQTELFNKTGSFFAVTDEQFNEAKREGVTYTNCGGHLICPSECAKELMTGLRTINKEAIQMDLTENGKEAVIKRELYNHEAFYDGDTERTFEALTGYNITQEDVNNVYQYELPYADC